MTGITPVPPGIQAQREEEIQHLPPGAQAAFRVVWALSDEDVLAVARTDLRSGPGSTTFTRVIAELGGDLRFGGRCNPWWLTGGAAVDAYERGLMEAEEMDGIVG
jgi:hypothetical protein